jgi:hypothetical protein
MPDCPLHGPMRKVTITQGNGKDERILGYAWFCVKDDSSQPDYCDYSEDCDDPIPVHKPMQLSFIE